MELLPELIFLGLVINRFVEWVKSLLSPATTDVMERRQTALILGLSFVLGALAMVFVFPARNMFPEAVSPFAGLIFTGILVGGVANGWDFTAGFAEALKDRAAANTPKTTVNVSANAENVRSANEITSHVAQSIKG